LPPRSIGEILPDALYTPEQAAEFLALTTNTIYVKLRTGELKGIKLRNRQWRVPGKSILDYLGG